MSNTKQITQFTFWDFCQEVEVAINEGYTFLNTNEGFPQATTGLYTCIMVKKEPVKTEPVVQPKAEKEVTENKLEVQPAARGRKAKN